jgi:hypothetical protein
VGSIVISLDEYNSNGNIVANKVMETSELHVLPPGSFIVLQDENDMV